MKLITNSKTQKVLILLALTLFTLLLSTKARKNKSKNTKEKPTINDVIYEAFKCRGPTTQLYKDNKDKDEFIVVCQEDDKFFYIQQTIMNDYVAAEKIKRSEKADPEIEAKLKKDFSFVDIYTKVDNKCNEWCGSFKKHDLYKIVGTEVHACKCSVLGVTADYFLIYPGELPDEPEQPLPEYLMQVKEAEKKNKLVPVSLKHRRRFRY